MNLLFRLTYLRLTWVSVFNDDMSSIFMDWAIDILTDPTASLTLARSSVMVR